MYRGWVTPTASSQSPPHKDVASLGQAMTRCTRTDPDLGRRRDRRHARRLLGAGRHARAAGRHRAASMSRPAARTGLAITGPVEEFTQVVPAVDAGRADRHLRRIVLAVKAQATEAALDALAPHLAADGFVLSAQNGLNELAIAAARRRGAHHGLLRQFRRRLAWAGRRSCYGNRGAVVVGEIDGAMRERTREMHALLRCFEPDAMLTDNIWGYLWGKLAYGAMLFATALNGRLDVGELRRPAALRRCSTRSAARSMAVAAARGVHAGRASATFDPTAFAPAPATPRSRAAIACARRLHLADRQDPFRHLARPRRAQAQDRGRPADRHHRARSAREAGIATPAIDTLVAPDPRHRGRPPAAILRHPAGADRHMHIRFDGRVALVTGAAQGIGRAIASALVEAGATRACRRHRRRRRRSASRRRIGHRAPLESRHRRGARPR